MRRYLLLLALGVALGALVFALGLRARPAPALEEEAPEHPVVALDLVVTPDGSLSPPMTSVPKDHLVKLTVTNRRRVPVSMTLMGYEGRLAIGPVLPDSTWRGEFLADRPGEDFTWLLAGAPGGRFQVTGSHLVEGHR